MKNQIIIHGSGKQTRIALIENGELAQLFIEAPENQRTVGDIYMAEVHKVMSGIRAAFISVGTPKDAFLHFSDVGENLEHYITLLNGEGAIAQAEAFNKELNKRFNNNQNSKEATETVSAGVEKQMRAGEVLQPGQRVLVQIVKEPIGSKGPRVSTDITIAGRFVVLIPMGDYVAVSKRIRSFKERKRLRNIVSNRLPDGFGIIVRTVAQNQPDKVLLEDVNDVLEKWDKIQSQLKSAKPPQLLYRDLDMTESLIRDLFAKDYNQMLIDDPEIYKTVVASVSKWAPEMVPNIKLYKGKEHVFDYMRISADVESVFSPRVKMPSGGYLIFEQTEAMYVVDVNSGRYAAKRHQEENSLKTNLEAAREIAKQLRLRDIGGIIVVDFIDLKDEVNRKKVYDELKKEFRKDKAKTNVLPMSDFGLVQITRQRIRPSVVNSVSKVCPMCGGTGELVSQNTIIADIEAWLSKFKHSYKKRSIDLYLNPYLRSFITKGIISERLKWMFKFGMKISVISDETVSMNDYRFNLPGTDVDVTETVMQDKPLESALKEREEELLRLTTESKMDRSNLDVFDKKGKYAKPGSKYRDLDDEDHDDHDHDADSDSDEMEYESKTPRKVINPREKYYKKAEENSNPVQEKSSATAKSSHSKQAKSEVVSEQFVSVEELKDTKPNYKDALEVAKAYAAAHHIVPKLVSDEDEDDYLEDFNSDSDSDSSDQNVTTNESTSEKLILKTKSNSVSEEEVDTDEELDEDDADDEMEFDDSSYDEDDSDEYIDSTDETDNDELEESDEDDDDEDSDEDDSESEKTDSDENESIDEDNEEENDTESQEIEAISVKSSIQFVETESDDHIELEIYKETIEVLEKTVSESSDELETKVEDAETDPISSDMETQSEELDRTDNSDASEELESEKTEVKKKRGRKPIKVVRKGTVEQSSPKQIIADSTISEEEETASTELEESKTTDVVKKTIVRKTTKKAATIAEESEGESHSSVEENVQEAPKIRVSTTKKTKAKQDNQE